MEKAAPLPAPLRILTFQLITATATAATVAAVFTARSAAATTATAARAFFTRASNVDSERAAIQFSTIQRFDGLVRFFVVAHRHETEATRTAGFAVRDEVCFGDSAV